MLKKPMLVVLFAALAAMLAGAPIFAQAAQNAQASDSDSAKAALEANVQLMREDIRSDRKQITAANVPLTADEATKFWPIYDEYIQETIKINDTRWALIKEYAANYDHMSDQLAQDYMKRAADVQQQLIELRTKYVPKFEKVVSPQKTAVWIQIDRRLDLVIDLQLASLIPVVTPNK
jgi:hypothetical protein